MNARNDGRVGFCVGTGRCGTTFIAQVVNAEPHVVGAHERERLGATFHMFCKWHHIPVDPEGFLSAKEEEIQQDLASHHFSFESSALLSHSLEELYDRFRAKFLLLIRNPADTVASFAVRGWFLRTPVRRDPSLPPTYKNQEKARHFLGRNLPNGEEFDRWAKLTQIGRLAWFWQARNGAILEQFRRLPDSHCRLERLEGFDFTRYCEMAEFMGWQVKIDESTFARLSQSRLNAGPNVPRTIDQWSDQEVAEFEQEVRRVAHAVGYEYRGEEILNGPSLQDRYRDAPCPTVAAALDAL